MNAWFSRRAWTRGLAPLMLGLLTGVAVYAESAFVVVVAKDSKAPPKLSNDEVVALFMGTAKSFPNGEKAVPIDHKAGTEGYATFYQKLNGKTEAQMKAYWSRIMFTGKGQPPQEAGDGGAVKKLIAANPNMLGYIEASLVDASVRVVAEVK
ncbi:phosphate ABC transporter substrate-binding protein [Inhella gelatinilytica]|uniref:Phosphate ABC transporter substrate-binding protein n=1 Tax=Inhella gelatinilytica TaxID=2795030 RepID=A0A931NCY0_9BURK|nr:phosphate ABC transporter substrate-binding protein [Inhella gelatinilytica]MBH9551675.1 phosphate ABC transporter substrate-binding protein [Inhella gelatinilytica]